MLTQAVTSFGHSLFFGFAGIVGIGLVIAFHELGHFLFCKLFNIYTPSFSIGFGPRLLTKKIGTTEFAISAIPLGGYVEIGGASQDDTTPATHSFRHKPWYQKFLVMIGGILFNILFAYGACSLLFMSGMPQSMMLYQDEAINIIGGIKEGSPAQKAGLQVGDVLVKINDMAISCPTDVTKTCTPKNPLTKSMAEAIDILKSPTYNPVALTIKRGQEQFEVTVTPEPKEFLGKKIGSTGIIFDIRPLPAQPFFTALSKGFTFANSLLTTSVSSLRHIFASGDTSMVAGPVMIISQTMKGAQQGIKTFLLFLAYISLSLAILNLLPLPILDGGQIVFYTIEAIVGKPIPDKVREYIHIACWVAFMALVVYLSFQDLKAILQPYLQKVYGLLGFGK